MPLPNEHAAEQMAPGACDKFRRQNDKFGPGVDVIFCVKGGKAEVQSIRFDAGQFTADEARAWLKKHDYSAAKFEAATGKGKADASAPRLLDLAAEGLPALLQAVGASEGLEIQAERVTPGGARLRAFAGTAYTGVSMRLPNYPLPVVADLTGMRVPNQRLPILRSHDPDRIIGHGEGVELSPQRLKAGGIISGVGAAAQEVLALATNGFPWQLSIGANVEQMELLDAKAEATVNGRKFGGPLYLARKTTLAEISFVPAGADPNSSATITGA